MGRLGFASTLLLPVVLLSLMAAACGGNGGDDPTATAASGTTAATGNNATGGGAGGAPAGGGAGSPTPPDSQRPPADTPTPTATRGPVFPIEFEVDSTAHTVTSGNPCGTPVSLAVRAGRVDTAIPTDPELSAGRQGEPDDRYVYLTFRALGISGQCGGANVVSRILRLEIDGLPTAGGNLTNFALRNGEGEDFVVVYVVPPDASQFRVLLGEAGETVAEIDIDIPTFDG